jgi:hypothetical protein
MIYCYIHILIKRELPPSLAGDTEKPLGMGMTVPRMPNRLSASIIPQNVGVYFQIKKIT